MDVDSYTINRKSAAKILKVTQRSIDRYIRSGKISARNVRGNIRLSRKELSEFKRGQPLIIPKALGDSFSRDLYEQVLRELQEKEQKLQMANYRIGQLESLQLHKDDSEIGEVHKLHQTHEILRKKLEREQFNRRILGIILYLLLALQPILWYLLRQPTELL